MGYWKLPTSPEVNKARWGTGEGTALGSWEANTCSILVTLHRTDYFLTMVSASELEKVEGCFKTNR